MDSDITTLPKTKFIQVDVGHVKGKKKQNFEKYLDDYYSDAFLKAYFND